MPRPSIINFVVGLIVIVILVFIGLGTWRVFQLKRSQESQTKAATGQTSSPRPSGFAQLPPVTALSPQPSPNASRTPVIRQPDTGTSDIPEKMGITLESPLAVQVISSPLTVSGHANVMSKNVSIILKDSNGNILAQKQIEACFTISGCAFSTNVEFPTPQTKKGTLEVYSKSSQDNSKLFSQSLNLNF